MTREEVKKILDQQLLLLAEESKKANNSITKIEIATSIVNIAKARLDYFKVD